MPSKLVVTRWKPKLQLPSTNPGVLLKTMVVLAMMTKAMARIVVEEKARTNTRNGNSRSLKEINVRRKLNKRLMEKRRKSSIIGAQTTPRKGCGFVTSRLTATRSPTLMVPASPPTTWFWTNDCGPPLCPTP